MSIISRIITGVRRDSAKIERNLTKIRDRALKKSLRSSLAKAGTPIVRELKRTVPVLTGSMKKAVGKRVWTNASEGRVGVIVGMRQNFVASDEHGNRIVPAKYMHLVERGFRHKGGKKVGPNPVVARAQSASIPEAVRILRSEVPAAISKEIAKF